MKQKSGPGKAPAEQHVRAGKRARVYGPLIGKSKPQRSITTRVSPSTVSNLNQSGFSRVMCLRVLPWQVR